MRLTRIEKQYQYQIYNLKKYYKSRHERSRELNGLESVKAFAWRYAIEKIENETDSPLMLTIKHVYILNDWTLSKAARVSLYCSHGQACKMVRDWFALLDVYFFEGLKHVI